nr:PH domain-containing protein [Murinocardiopsis flavida]
MGAMLVLAVILPPEWKAQDRASMVLFGVVGVAVLGVLARPKVIAAEGRVTVVNCIRTYVLEWAEIIDVRMPVGEPWPTIDLADGTTVGAMGIQSNDGKLAAAQLAAFRAMVHERGEAEEPPRAT